jgi:hypothetical protein
MEIADKVDHAVKEGLVARGRRADRIDIRLVYCFREGLMKYVDLNVPVSLSDTSRPRGLVQSFAEDASAAAQRRGEKYRPENLSFSITFYEGEE